jgi:hypothetical protein
LEDRRQKGQNGRRQLTENAVELYIYMYSMNNNNKAEEEGERERDLKY